MCIVMWASKAYILLFSRVKGYRKWARNIREKCDFDLEFQINLKRSFVFMSNDQEGNFLSNLYLFQTNKMLQHHYDGVLGIRFDVYNTNSQMHTARKRRIEYTLQFFVTTKSYLVKPNLKYWKSVAFPINFYLRKNRFFILSNIDY